MKRTILILISLGALGLSACDDNTDSLTGQRSGASNPNGTAGGENSTYNHSNDPGGAAPGADFQPPDPAQVAAVGAPEVTSRLHACGKLSVNSLGNILDSRGLTGGGQRPNGATSGKALYDKADTPATLGAANYDGRVPEAPFASTSAVSKMFDIFSMSSYDVIADSWSAPACPGVKVIGSDGKFTKDGISCLIGKPATDEHVAIANDAVAKNPTDGAKIAITALLSAAHTCQ